MTARTDPVSAPQARKTILAYGHAAYCAGWKAAVKCLAKPNAIPDGHGRKWIESTPPETFTQPLIWRDGTEAKARGNGSGQ